jgi:hypothetical protein
MIVQIKYFHENTQEDYEKYNKLWRDNIERIAILHTNLSIREQMRHIREDIDENKDILGIRFPRMNEITKNNIISSIILGNGITIDGNKLWLPKEIWVYCVMIK